MSRFALTLLALAAAPAFAQFAQPPAAPPPAIPAPASQPAASPIEQSSDLLPWHRDDKWTVRFEPSVYYVGMSGTATLPRASGATGPNPSVRLAEINADEPRLSPAGEINLRKGEWGIAVRGFGFSSSGDATTTAAGQLGDVIFAQGDIVNRGLDFNAFEVEGTYNLLKDKLRPLEDGTYGVRTRLDLVGGVRLYDVDLRLSSLGTGGVSSQNDEVFVQGEVGVKGSVEFYDHFTVDLQLDAGGGPDGYSFDILVGGSWKPINNFGVQIGYRALFFDVDSGSGNSKFKLEGAAQGLYAGIVLEF
ncbi:MAG: hypothetical protein WC718_11185 [Phycisphaerales bacterium]|jgi:hypothetical protein